MLIFFVINLLLYKISCAPSEHTNNESLPVKEVSYGGTALLQCRSNGKNFIFDYWLFHNRKVVIGPANSYDKQKYKYEILSGNLTVKGATPYDQGRYSCVSKAVIGAKVNVENIDLIILQDWNEINEHDPNINEIRILIALIVLVLLGAGGYLLYTIWRDRYLYPRYLEQYEDEDEDSGEEIFSAPSTSGMQTQTRPKTDKTESFDNISTDFKSILDTANDK